MEKNYSPFAYIIIFVLAVIFSYFFTSGILALILFLFDSIEMFTWGRAAGVWVLLIVLEALFKKGLKRQKGKRTMLKYYHVTYRTFVNDEKLIPYSGTTIQEEEAAQDKKFFLDWNNVEEISERLGIYLGFSIWKKRKGRVIDFFGKAKNIKEWKSNELNLRFEIHFKEMSPPSIAEILKYSDGEKAIRYLNQLGLKLNLTETEKHDIM